MNKKSVIGAWSYQLQLIYMHKRPMTKVGTTAEEMQALKMDKMPFNGATYDHCGDEATGDQLLYRWVVCSIEGNTRDVCELAMDGVEMK
jgi:hypothetical protein